MTCQHCRAETTNGLALCELCQEAVRTYFTYLPIYFRNLARQQRPGRPNGSLSTSGQWLIRRGETDTSLIPRALGSVVNDLTTWARALADDRGVDLPDVETETETVAALCALLVQHLTSIATLEWAGQFVRDVSRHERTLRQLTETAVPGWYAGACRQSTGRDMEGNEHTCGASTYVVPGLTWVTCRSCGATTYARDHLDAVIEEAREWLARPKRLAEAIVALVDTEQSVPRLYERIKKWEQREKIAGVQRTERGYEWSEDEERFVVAVLDVGPKRYRLGDVLDLVFTEGATRLNAPSTKVS